MCIEELIKLLLAAMTPLIAAVAVYIAWQQWMTNKQKIQMDLYDRRYKIYEEVTKILSIVFQNAVATNSELIRFKQSVAEAEFLFESDVKNFTEEIYMRGLKLQLLTDQYKELLNEQKDNLENIRKTNIELEWFVAQFEKSQQIFGKYLKIGT